MGFFGSFIDELGKIAVAVEEPAVLFHGSPRSLKVIEPRDFHGAPGVGKAVFATPSEVMSKAYLARWDDRLLGQHVNVVGPEWSKTRMSLIEMQPGAFEKVFGRKKGYVYELSVKGFKPFEGTHVEMVRRKPVVPVKVRRVKNVLEELRSDPNFRLIRFDPMSKEFKQEVLHRRKGIARMSPRERAEYERWFREGAHPEAAAAIFGSMKKTAAKRGLQQVIEGSYEDPWGNTRRVFAGKKLSELRKELVLIRDKNRRIVGFMHPQPGRAGGVRTGYIYVSPEARGKGYGSRALREFGKRPRAFSFVDVGNVPSQRAHEAAGWVRSGKHGQRRPESETWVPGPRKS